MNSVINELVKLVVDKNSINECSVAELQQMVSRSPYFGPAQFLLAQKLKQENSPLFDQQSQKSILYFRDHLWFDYLSADENTGTMSVVKKGEHSLTPATEPVVTQKAIEPFVPQQLHNTLPETETSFAQEPAAPDTEEMETVTVAEEPLPAPVLIEESQAEPVMEESDEETGQEDSAPLIPLPNFKIEHANAAAVPLVFEPYHTVDYFASQGIKFKEEEKPKDKFGQQLKSFTEWLKAMKKLPDTPTQAVQPAVPDDQKVAQLADRSISDRQVVTEAMAEVWEKQGNREKAAEIYRKLSLLNPAKSSYFAAKIDHLKNS